MKMYGRNWFRVGAVLAGAALWLSTGGSAFAQSFTLEGCKSDGSPYPANGPFVCATGDYTTGNLGKNWNELDNVPFRLTIRTGQNAASGQVALVVDREDVTRPGYDRISDATLVAGSNPACAGSLAGELLQTPGIGGVGVSLYRLLNYSQAAGLDCTYDFYARLALGSSQFPGASLHTNVGRRVNGVVTTQGVGARDISIPVNELTPPEAGATLSASAAADSRWTIDKTADKANLNFGDVCSADAPFEQPVKFTVTWQKVAASGGKVTVEAKVSATNNASRTINVQASGVIRAEETATDKPVLGGIVALAPNSTTQVLSTTVEFTAAEAGGVGDLVSFRDLQLAFFDPDDFGELLGNLPIPTVTTVITKGSEANSTAIITDSTSIDPTATWLNFSSQQNPLVGQYQGYTAGSFVGGPIDWVSDTQSTGGSVSFSDVVRLGERRVFNGTLTNNASLTTSDSASASVDPVTVGLSSFATVRLTINKTLSVPQGFLSPGQFVRIKFRIEGTDGYLADREVLFLDSETGMTKQVAALSGLVPDVYTVSEVGASIEDGAGLNAPIALHDPESDTRTVDLQLLPDGVATCTGSTSFNNEFRPAYPTAKVEKNTIPAQPEGGDGSPWSFTLTGPGLTASGISMTDAANDSAGSAFGVNLTQPGTYTVTETQQTGWDLSSVAPSTNGSSCSFTVVFPQDQGRVFSCAFTNTKRGSVKVIKTVSGGALSLNSSFSFQVREGASPTSLGTVLSSGTANAGNNGTVVFKINGNAYFLMPGQAYQVCETGLPVGWATTLSAGGFRPNSVNDPDGDNSTVCQSFTAQAGVTTTFEVDNAPPSTGGGGGDGDARTIGYWKNHNDCKRSKGSQATSGKTTINSALGATGSIRVGDLNLYAANCSTIVNLLDKRDTKGAKRASLPEFNLASQLTAALLNGKAGAGSCPANEEAKADGQTLLDEAGFVGNALSPALSAANARIANSLAGILDDYNNNELCQ